MGSIKFGKCYEIKLNLIVVNTNSFGWHGTSGMTKLYMFKSTATISFLSATSNKTTLALKKQSN